MSACPTMCQRCWTSCRLSQPPPASSPASEQTLVKFQLLVLRQPSVCGVYDLDAKQVQNRRQEGLSSGNVHPHNLVVLESVVIYNPVRLQVPSSQSGRPWLCWLGKRAVASSNLSTLCHPLSGLVHHCRCLQSQRLWRAWHMLAACLVRLSSRANTVALRCLQLLVVCLGLCPLHKQTPGHQTFDTMMLSNEEALCMYASLWAG